MPVFYITQASCFGRVFNFKLGSFHMYTTAQRIQVRPILELKTRPRFHPINSSLPMIHLGETRIRISAVFHCCLQL
jgi:hypothetical protein